LDARAVLQGNIGGLRGLVERERRVAADLRLGARQLGGATGAVGRPTVDVHVPVGHFIGYLGEGIEVDFLLSVEQSDVPAWCDLVAVDLVHPLLIALTDAHRTARLGGRVNAVASGNHPVGVDDGTGAHALVGVGIINADGD